MKNKLFTLPNILTLANLACGCAATVFVLSDTARALHPDIFFRFIAAAAVFDLLDGAVARLTGHYSDVGRQLDSLADVVSFGVAPSAALYVMYMRSEPLRHAAPLWYDALGWGMFAVALFAALRLARFNIDATQREEFTGLPTPAAGLAVASVWYMGSGSFPASREGYLLLAAVICWLLVSPVRMFSLKFKNFGWRGNELRYIFIAASLVLVAALGPAGAGAATGLYVTVSVVRHISLSLRRE